MKNSTLSTLTMLLVSCVIMLTSCSKTVSDIDDPSASYGGNSSLNIITRSGNEDAKVSYPVQVYLFNSNNACIAVQTLADANESLSIEDLKAGTYHVYAVGAAEENRYTLPTQEAAAATSAITLQEGKIHEDLMLANNDDGLVPDFLHWRCRPEWNANTNGLRSLVTLPSSEQSFERGGCHWLHFTDGTTEAQRDDSIEN